MLFNSFEFLLFLPLVLLGYHGIVIHYGNRASLLFLACASLFFYGWWKPEYLWIILSSIVFNYLVSLLLLKQVASGKDHARRLLLAGGVAGNLALLGFYKYAGLMVTAFNSLSPAQFSVPDIVLPLAISFFTFQQIAYLVDISAGKTRGGNFPDYLVFVTFFPQLIAGPIVHHAEMMPQFQSRNRRGIKLEDLQIGLSLFALGLAKKVLLADNLAPLADASFALADAGQSQGSVSAWMGAGAYSLQIYFDFSGYTDMALGLGRMFGIRLPLNFFSPYKARNIIDFWHRWHMTLSRFLRDYLYVPLGGNRRGRPRRYLNLLLTMLLGGLWHGAAVTFILWGGLHGLYLCINHGWRWLLGRLQLSWLAHYRSYGLLCGLVTLLAVVLAWVVFRAETSAGAWRMWQDMFAFSGAEDLKILYRQRASDFDLLLKSLLPVHVPLGDIWYFSLAQDAILLLLGGLLCLCLPNSIELFRHYHPSVSAVPEFSGSTATSRLAWKPSLAWAAGLGLLFFASLMSLARVAPFLYFQF
ncbi:MAG: MBOAT family O-acyltransferase [Halieaceae bacterium]